MSNPHRFELISFDCYGTLIDWESGILAALRPVLAARGVTVADEALLEVYGRVESRLTAGPYRRYRDVLQETARGIGRELGFEPTVEEAGVLAASLPRWEPFPDTVAALEALSRRHRLAVVSNVDRDLFESTARRLAVRFDRVITAEELRAYKPSLEAFRRAVAAFGVPARRILHVAQSLYHDIAPASRVGLTTAWIDRRGGRAGSGATPAAEARPDLVFAGLRELADALRAGSARVADALNPEAPRRPPPSSRPST